MAGFVLQQFFKRNKIFFEMRALCKQNFNSCSIFRKKTNGKKLHYNLTSLTSVKFQRLQCRHFIHRFKGQLGLLR